MRYPIRARVLKRGDQWMTLPPTGHRRLFYRWSSALAYADRAVREERRFVALKDFDSRRMIL